MLATTAGSKPAHLGLAKGTGGSELTLTMGKGASGYVAVATLQEGSAHARPFQVGFLADFAKAVCKRATISFAAAIREKKLAHLSLHELTSVHLPYTSLWNRGTGSTQHCPQGLE